MAPHGNLGAVAENTTAVERVEGRCRSGYREHSAAAQLPTSRKSCHGRRAGNEKNVLQIKYNAGIVCAVRPAALFDP